MSCANEQERAGTTLRLVKRLAVFVVTFGSCAWAGLLLVQVWPALAGHIHEVRIPLLALGLLLSVVSAYLTFEVFAVLAGVVGITPMPKRCLAHLYFTGQLLKHLPGRVWGIGYQWVAGHSSGSVGDWVLANLGHMLLATFFALWTAWLALAAAKGVGWGALTLGAGVAAYSGGWLLVTSSTLKRLIDWLPGRTAPLNKGLGVLAGTPFPARLRIFLLFCGTALFLYAAWITFGLAYPPLGASGGVRLCAYYMIAWFVGYVSLLTPSGMGVRELVFAWMAQDFGGDVVALMAIVGRGSLLAVDVLLGLLFAPFSPRR